MQLRLYKVALMNNYRRLVCRPMGTLEIITVLQFVQNGRVGLLQSTPLPIL